MQFTMMLEHDYQNLKLNFIENPTGLHLCLYVCIYYIYIYSSLCAGNSGCLSFHCWVCLQSCKTQLLTLSCLSVQLSAWKNSAPTRRTFLIFKIWLFLKNLLRKHKFHYNQAWIMGTLHEDQYTILIISHSVLLRMRNVSDKSFRKKKLFNNFFSKIMVFTRWDNVEKYCRPRQATDDSIVHAHCMLDS
jgi:hypothetical protein